jgi:hypothetical protein
MHVGKMELLLLSNVNHVVFVRKGGVPMNFEYVTSINKHINTNMVEHKYGRGKKQQHGRVASNYYSKEVRQFNVG